MRRDHHNTHRGSGRGGQAIVEYLLITAAVIAAILVVKGAAATQASTVMIDALSNIPRF